jgi:hypothetical protein
MLKLLNGMWTLREFFSKAYRRILKIQKVKTMSQKTNPKLPAIPDLSPDQLHRLLCADYLESIARLIRQGQVTGFDLAWDMSAEQPAGRVEVESDTFVSPLKQRLLRDIAEAQAAAAKQIQVIDATQHDKCDNENCVACNNPNKA